MKTTAIYLRYSSENQRDSFSIPMQRRECRRFAEHQFPSQQLREFVDEAESAMQHARPAYQALLSAARAGEVHTVVVYKYDRFGRNQIDQLLGLEELEQQLGIEVWSATEPRDTVVRGILGVIAQFESEKLGRRLRDAGREAVRQGYAFGRPPYGYKIKRVQVGERTRAKFIIDGRAAAVVREIYRACADGDSYRSIIATLNGRGEASPAGGTWDIGGLQAILHNEAYTGSMVRGRIERREMRDGTCRNVVKPRDEWVVKPDAHAAIIDPDLWSRVRQALARRGADARRSANRVMPAGRRRYLLSGVLKCADCGGSFIALATRSKGKRYWSYACGRRRTRGDSVCKNETRLSGRKLEQEVLRAIAGELRDMADDIEDAVRTCAEASVSPTVGAEVAEIDGRIRRATRLLLDCPDADADVVRQELRRLRARRDKVRRNTPSKVPSAAAIRNAVSARLDALREAVAPGTETAKARSALERIVHLGLVYPAGSVLLEGDLLSETFGVAPTVNEADPSCTAGATSGAVRPMAPFRIELGKVS